MGDLSTFFKESESSLGVFYPKHYIIATFPKYSVAKEGYQQLRSAGFGEDEVMLATGREVLNYFKDFREDAGLWGIVMRPISRFIGTEVGYSDENIEQAREGAGFLAIHSQTDQSTKAIMEHLTPLAPSSAEWYLAGGVRSLA
jgi:hypothetical protein